MNPELTDRPVPRVLFQTRGRRLSNAKVAKVEIVHPPPNVRTVPASPSSAPPVALERDPLLPPFRLATLTPPSSLRRRPRDPRVSRIPGTPNPASLPPRTSASPCARAPPPPRAAPTSAASRPARWTRVGVVDASRLGTDTCRVRPSDFRVRQSDRRSTATGPRRRPSDHERALATHSRRSLGRYDRYEGAPPRR